LYLRRAKPKEIQAQLGLPNVRIVYYWIARGGWDEMLTDEEPLTAISRRITLLLEKPEVLAKGELDELDRLTGIRERLLKQAARPAPPSTIQAPAEYQEHDQDKPRGHRRDRGDRGSKRKEKK